MSENSSMTTPPKAVEIYCVKRKTRKFRMSILP